MTSKIPWEKIYAFTLSCGSVHDLKAFSIEILSGLRKLCDFDQSLVYFLDGNGKVCNQYLMNIDKRWSTMYLEYYSKTDNGRYDLSKKVQEDPIKPSINIRAWKKEPDTEFIANYIHSRGINYSLGFVLFDLNGKPRTLFALDKERDENFSESELLTLSLAVPQLNNLHKNFFYQQANPKQNVDAIAWETTNLTTREVEIASLLCQGIAPATISQTLYISRATTYKHIAHIYEKLHVSSLQELLVRLLGQENPN